MGCKAVSISRTMGAGGEEVGRSVAADLGFRYVDNEIITQAAERAGVSPEVVEQNERTQPLLIRILAAIAKAPAEPEAMLAPANNPGGPVGFSGGGNGPKVAGRRFGVGLDQRVNPPPGPNVLSEVDLTEHGLGRFTAGQGPESTCLFPRRDLTGDNDGVGP